MDNGLDDVLNGDGPTVEEAQPSQTTGQPEGVETPPDGPDRDESGRFKAKGEKEEGAPPASNEKSKGLEAGISAERKKRQEWESRYGDLESRYNTLEQQIAELKRPKEPDQPPPSIWDDENAWQQDFGGRVVSTAVQQASLNAKLDMSEMMARQAHEDFEDMKTAFMKMAESNPTIVQQALNDPHPWNRAYQIAKNAATMEELGATDIESLKAQLLEQLKAEQAQQPPQIPQSLAGEQSARGSNAAPNNGPPSLNDILKG